MKTRISLKFVCKTSVSLLVAFWGQVAVRDTGRRARVLCKYSWAAAARSPHATLRRRAGQAASGREGCSRDRHPCARAATFLAAGISSLDLTRRRGARNHCTAGSKAAFNSNFHYIIHDLYHQRQWVFSFLSKRRAIFWSCWLGELVLLGVWYELNKTHANY
jgi:hypothetical protein